MAAGNRRQIGYVREGSIGVMPASPAFKVLKMMGGNGLILDRDELDTNEWRTDRSVREMRSGVNKPSMSAPFNFAFSAYEDMLEAALFSRWLPSTGANPVTLAVSVTVAASTFTRASGSFITDGFAVGGFVIVSGFVNPQNNGVFLITNLTATIMTVSVATLVVETLANGSIFDAWNGLPLGLGAATVTVAASGKTFTRSAGSWITDGVAVGDYVTFAGFSNSGNNGTFKVSAVTGTVITCSTATGLADEATVSGIKYADGRQILKDSVYPVSFSFEEQQLDIASYKLFNGFMLNQFQLTIKPNAPISGQADFIGTKFTGLYGASQGASISQPPATFSFDSFTGYIKEGGSAIAIATGLDFTLTNGLVAKYFLFARDAGQIDADDTMISGTFQVYFKDQTLLTKFTAETETTLEFNLQDLSGNQYTVKFPRVKYSSAKPNVTKPDITNEFAFKALYDTVSGCHVQITKIPA